MKQKQIIEKINREELIEFEKQEKEKIIKLHKIGLYLCFIINIILFLFILIYKYQLYYLKNENKYLTEEIYNQTSFITNQDKIIQHQIVNLFSLLYSKEKLIIIENFKNSDEMYSIMLEGGIKDPNNENFFLCYKGTFDNDNIGSIGTCTGKELLLIIRTKNNERFGGFISNFNYSSINYTHYSSKTFLFHMDKNGIYKKFIVKNPDKAFYYDPHDKIVFGNEDLVIKNNWNTSENSCYSKFPNNYGDNSNNISDLIGNENQNKIEIAEIEIISFTIDNNFF